MLWQEPDVLQQQRRVLQFGPGLLRQHYRRLYLLLFRSGLLHGCLEGLLQRCQDDLLQGRVLQLNPDLLQREVLQQWRETDLLRHHR